MTVNLNGIMEDVGAVMGFQAANRLIAVFGGAKLYVPNNIPPSHPIAKVVGDVAAARLADAFGSETIDLPSNEEFLRLRRVRAVATLTKQGFDCRDISEHVGVSMRHVRNLARKAGALGLLKSVGAGSGGLRQARV